MMHPSKVVREKMCKLTDLPNIAKAGAADLVLLGIKHETELALLTLPATYM